MNLISYLGIFIIFYTKNKLLPIFTPFSILLLHRLYLYYYYIFYICTIFILYYYLLYYFKFYSKFHQFLSLSFLNLSAKNDRYRNSNTVTFHRNAPFEWSKLSHLENMCTPHENIVSEGKMFFFCLFDRSHMLGFIPFCTDTEIGYIYVCNIENVLCEQRQTWRLNNTGYVCLTIIE